jgi:hypothetical protein
MATRQMPVKPSGDTVVKPLRGTGPVKGTTAPRIRAAKGRKLKPRVDAKTARAARTAPPPIEAGGWPELGEQRQARRAAARKGERYVRLQIRVENGQMSVVDSHVVDGPLAQTATFEGRYAYEVSASGRLLHAGSIPDVSVVRGFAHPNGTLEQRRHHTYELASYDFHARVPAGALDRSILPRIAVVLYRVKEHPPTRAPIARALSPDPLGVQLERELREVGRVVGLPAWVLESGPRKAAAQSAVRARPATTSPRREKKK